MDTLSDLNTFRVK